MATNDLEWLGTWYQQQCNGRWEHQKGMLLEPVASATQESWRLRIDLRGTSAAGFAPRKLSLCELRGSRGGSHGASWIHCSLNAQSFQGEGAEVEELIGVFRRWIGPDPRLDTPAFEAASAG